MQYVSVSSETNLTIPELGRRKTPPDPFFPIPINPPNLTSPVRFRSWNVGELFVLSPLIDCPVRGSAPSQWWRDAWFGSSDAASELLERFPAESDLTNPVERFVTLTEGEFSFTGRVVSPVDPRRVNSLVIVVNP